MTMRDSASALSRLADRYWDEHLRDDPLKATEVGDRRFDDRLPDLSVDAVAARREGLQQLSAEIEAIDAQSLDDAGLTTRDALVQVVESDVAMIDADLRRHTVSTGNVPIGLLDLAGYQPADTPDAREAMAARWRAIGPFVDELIVNLARGLEGGAVGVRKLVDRSISQLDEVLARPDEDWPFVSPADNPDLDPEERARFRDGLLEAMAGSIRPALVRYRGYLVDTISPVARDDD